MEVMRECEKLHSLPVSGKDRDCHIVRGVSRATGGGKSPTWEDTEV